MGERWPSILRPKTIKFHIKSMVTSGPKTFDGNSQLGGPDAGYWTASLTFPVLKRDQVLEFRGFIAALEGGLNEFEIGVFDRVQAPFLTPQTVNSGIPHSDGALFTDETGYQQSTVSVVLTDLLPLRATSATVTVIQAGPIRRGMYFSIANRLYMVTSVPVTDGDQVSFTFRPPLRKLALAGAPVNFGRPIATMRLSDPQSGELDLSGLYVGEPTLDLEESRLGL